MVYLFHQLSFAYEKENVVTCTTIHMYYPDCYENAVEVCLFENTDLYWCRLSLLGLSIEIAFAHFIFEIGRT